MDKKSFIFEIENINPKGKTPISRSLLMAAKELRYTEEKATVILISDGKENCDANPCETAEKSEKLGVDFIIHIVGFDVDKETEAQLKCIAKVTGGKCFIAQNAEDLNKAMSSIVEEVNVIPIDNIKVKSSKIEGGVVNMQITELHEVLRFDETLELRKITERIRDILRNNLKRRGLVVAMSGGIDSSVSAALCVKALGSEKVFGLLLPETDSSSKSLVRGKALANHLKIEYLKVDIADTLNSIGCYHWRDEAIRSVFPEYENDWKNKIIIKGGIKGKINHFDLVVQSPSGDIFKKKMNLKSYLQIVAATNFKQRIRKTIEFFHADRLNYAVVGTPNRVEYDQGFFVKNGDGSADIKPIAHLYKTQVYALARYLKLPDEICSATPTTDTYSMPQGQDEFYYGLPYDKMDLALWAHNKNLPVEQLAEMVDITTEQASFIYKDIETKRRTTAMLHWPALLIENVDGPIRKPE